MSILFFLIHINCDQNQHFGQAVAKEDMGCENTHENYWFGCYYLFSVTAKMVQFAIIRIKVWYCWIIMNYTWE